MLEEKLSPKHSAWHMRRNIKGGLACRYTSAAFTFDGRDERMLLFMHHTTQLRIS